MRLKLNSLIIVTLLFSCTTNGQRDKSHSIKETTKENFEERCKIFFDDIKAITPQRFEDGNIFLRENYLCISYSSYDGTKHTIGISVTPADTSFKMLQPVLDSEFVPFSQMDNNSFEEKTKRKKTTIKWLIDFFYKNNCQKITSVVKEKMIVELKDGCTFLYKWRNNIATDGYAHLEGNWYIFKG